MYFCCYFYFNICFELDPLDRRSLLNEWINVLYSKRTFFYSCVSNIRVTSNVCDNSNRKSFFLENCCSVLGYRNVLCFVVLCRTVYVFDIWTIYRSMREPNKSRMLDCLEFNANFRFFCVKNNRFIYYRTKSGDLDINQRVTVNSC